MSDRAQILSDADANALAGSFEALPGNQRQWALGKLQEYRQFRAKNPVPMGPDQLEIERKNERTALGLFTGFDKAVAGFGPEAKPWQDFYAGLPEDQKQLARVTRANEFFAAHILKRPPTAIGGEAWPVARASIANQLFEGRGRGSDNDFHQEATKYLTRQRDERVMLQGYADDDGDVDAETVKKARIEALVSKGYWAAADEIEFDADDPLDGAADMISGFQKWQEANRGKTGYQKGQEDRYFALWERQYKEGRKEKMEAVEAIKAVASDMAITGVSGSDTLLPRIVDKLETLSPRQRGMAFEYLRTFAGSKEGPKVKEQGGIADVLSRAISNLGDSVDRGARRSTLTRLKFSEGDTVPVRMLADGADSLVTEYSKLSSGPGKRLWLGIESVPLTAAQAKAANTEVERRMQRLELEAQVVSAAQNTLAPIERHDALWKVPLYGAVESVPSMLLAGSGVGALAVFEAYRSDSYEKMIGEGLSRKAAGTLSGFIGAAQSALDYVGFRFLKGVPGFNELASKWSTSTAILAGGRFISTTAAQTGLELTQDFLAEAMAKDVYAWMTKSIPGGNLVKSWEEMKSAAPETMMTMAILSALGTGHAHLSDVRAADRLVRTPEALERLGFDPKQIDNVVYASNGAAGEVFKEEWARRKPSLPGDKKSLTPSEAEAVLKKTPPPVLPVDVPEPEEVETEAEEAPAPGIIGTFQEPPMTASASIEDFREEEARANRDAGVRRVYRDGAGWHLEVESPMEGQTRIIDAGSFETAHRIREEMATTKLTEQIAELQEEVQEVAETLEEQQREKEEEKREALLEEAPSSETESETESPAPGATKGGEVAEPVPTGAPPTGLSESPALSGKVKGAYGVQTVIRGAGGKLRTEHFDNFNDAKAAAARSKAIAIVNSDGKTILAENGIRKLPGYGEQSRQTQPQSPTPNEEETRQGQTLLESPTPAPETGDEGVGGEFAGAPVERLKEETPTTGGAPPTQWSKKRWDKWLSDSERAFSENPDGVVSFRDGHQIKKVSPERYGITKREWDPEAWTTNKLGSKTKTGAYVTKVLSKHKTLAEVIEELYRRGLNEGHEHFPPLPPSKSPEKITKPTPSQPPSDKQGERDKGKVEQMTPEEFLAARPLSKTESAHMKLADKLFAETAKLGFTEGGTETPRLSRSAVEKALKGTGFSVEDFTTGLAGGVRLREAPGNLTGYNLTREPSASEQGHRESIFAALQGQKPVSAAAVDAYGIKLPEGYVKKGELYVKEGGEPGKGKTLKAPEEMTAAEINKELDKLDARQSANTDALIAAGRGTEKYYDTINSKATDSLTVEAQEVWKRRSDLRREVEARYGPDAPSRLPTRGFGPRAKPAPAPSEKRTTISDRQTGKEGKEGASTDFGSTNKIFTMEKAEKARKNLRDKLGRVNTLGADPSIVVDGIQLGGYLLEGGIRKFSAWSAEMIKQIGEGIRPHLKKIYAALRNDDDAKAFRDEMDSEADIEGETKAPGELPALSDEFDEERNDQPEGVGVLNASVAQQRERRALDPRRLPEPVTKEELEAQVKAIIASNPNYTQELELDLVSNPRPITALEQVLLSHELKRREDRYKEQQQRVKDAPNDIAKEEELRTLEAWVERDEELFRLTEGLGTIAARSLQARQFLVTDEFSLVRMLNKAFVANGGDLSKEQRDDVKKQHADLKANQKEQEAKEEERIQQRVAAILEHHFGAVAAAREQAAAAKKKGISPLKWLEEQAEKAEERRRARAGQLGSGFQLAADLFDATVIGAVKLAKGIKSLADFTVAMVQKYGESIKPHIKTVYEAAQEYRDAATEADDTTGKAKAKREKKAAGDMGKALAEAEIEKADGATEPDKAIIRDLARAHILSGKHGVEDVMKAVHKDLAALYPDLTVRRVMEIYSDYGIAIFPSKDALKTEERELRALARLTVTVERLQEGLPALKTGPQRDKATAEVRALNKQIAELKKKLGFSQKSEAQLAGLLDAIKTRLRNEIEDLSARIARGGSTKEELTPEARTKYDAEALELVRKRDALKDTLAKLDGPKEISEARKIELALAALERTEELLTRRLETGERAPAKKDSVTSEELELRRSYLATMREELKARAGRDATKEEEAKRKALDRATEEYLRRVRENDISSPGKKQGADSQAVMEARMARDKAREEYLEVREGRRDEITLARDKKATETRMRKLKEKIDKGEFTKPAKRERKVDDELMRLRHEEQQIKERFLEGVLAANLARRTRFARIIDGFKEFAHFTRAFFTAFDLSATLRQGGFISLGHPVMASKLVKTMLKSAWSEAYQLSRQHELLQRENSKNGLYTAAGLELLKATGVTLAQMEEAYMGRWIQKIPQMAGGGFLRGSARAYTTFLNELRAEAFDALAFSLTPTGKPTLEEAKAIATYVNLATGRGKLSGRWQQSAVTLNTIFFAPKYVASRWQLMLGLPFWRGNARTRRLIAGEYARWAIGLGVIYGLYALFHAGDDDDEVDFDWRSSSFGKLKFGDTFLDPLSGIAQNTALVGRLVSNETKTASGVTKSLEPGGPPGQRNRVDVIWGYIRSKFSPLVGATFSGLAHEDMQGERTNLVREYGRIMVPLTFQDVAETLEEQGLPKGMAISLASILGWGVTTYDNENREELDRDDANWLYDKELAVPRLSKDSTADDVTPGSVFGLTHKIAKARGMDSPLTEEQKETLLKRSLPKVTEAIEKAREDFKDMPDDEAGRAAEMAKIQHELDRRVSHARRDALLKMLRE